MPLLVEEQKRVSGETPGREIEMVYIPSILISEEGQIRAIKTDEAGGGV